MDARDIPHTLRHTTDHDAITLAMGTCHALADTHRDDDLGDIAAACATFLSVLGGWIHTAQCVPMMERYTR